MAPKGVPVQRCTGRAPQGHRNGPTLGDVDNRAEVREFLVSRRAKVTPEQAGLRSGGPRRVPGLRRSEVAALAGMSVEYYSKLERGALAGATAGVLGAIARALQLDEAERAHLFDLARAAEGTDAIERPASGVVTLPSRGGRSPMYADPARPPVLPGSVC